MRLLKSLRDRPEALEPLGNLAVLIAVLIVNSALKRARFEAKLTEIFDGSFGFIPHSDDHQ